MIFDDSDVAIEEIMLQRGESDTLGMFDTEQTEQGEQAVIPGAEQISGKRASPASTPTLRCGLRQARRAWMRGCSAKPDTQLDLEESIEAQGTLLQRERFDVGRSLSKEQRKTVMKSLRDVYKDNQVQKVEKGLDRRGDDLLLAIRICQTLFLRSDITGSPIRHHVTYRTTVSRTRQSFSQDTIDSRIEREYLAADAARRQNAEVADRWTKPEMQFDSLGEAENHWNKKSADSPRGLHGSPSIYPASERTHYAREGQHVLTPQGLNDEHVAELRARGWNPPGVAPLQTAAVNNRRARARRR